MNICKVCGKEYRVVPSKMKTSKTCMNTCKGRYAGKISGEKIHARWENETPEETRLALLKTYERFVVKKEGCWSWKGVKKKKLPYGCLTFRGNRNLTAHRVSYELHIGTIPEGMLVLHKCDNAECSNPDHLFLGTMLDNRADQIAKGRAVVEKLNVDKVKEIKRMLSKGILHKVIAKHYGISLTTVWSIQTRRTWSDIIVEA